MTLDKARQLQQGDRITHDGFWSNRTSRPETFEVVMVTDECIRVRNSRGKISLYQWSGCSTFVTRDFFESCTLAHDRV